MNVRQHLEACSGICSFQGAGETRGCPYYRRHVGEIMRGRIPTVACFDGFFILGATFPLPRAFGERFFLLRLTFCSV